MADYSKVKTNILNKYLHGILHILGVVPFDVVMRSDGVLELISHHHTRSLGAGTTGKQHDAGDRVGAYRLQQKHGLCEYSTNILLSYEISKPWFIRLTVITSKNYRLVCTRTEIRLFEMSLTFTT